jgi:hypothetical protein
MNWWEEGKAIGERIVASVLAWATVKGKWMHLTGI